MNNESKAKSLIEIRKMELQEWDKSIQQQGYATFVGLGIVLAFLFLNQLIEVRNLFGVLAGGAIISLVIIRGWRQDNKHIRDCYDGLCWAIENDKLGTFKFPQKTWSSAFYYKKKY